MTLGDAVASYAQRVNIDTLPLALVAIYQDMVIGTGSLKLQDLDVRPQLTPWMVESSWLKNIEDVAWRLSLFTD